MRLATLTPKLEKPFWDLVKQDYWDYYFFIYDWLLEKEKTQIFLALNGDVIAGLMLVYEGNIIQMRGEPAAVDFMLRNLQLRDFVVQVPLDCEGLLSKRFPVFALKEHITLMVVDAANACPSGDAATEQLDIADADAVAALMRQCYPEMWNNVTGDYVRQHFHTGRTFWVGIKYEGKLVAFGYAVTTPEVGHVTWIATDQKWRKRGYATSIVSALLKECLNNAPTAMIYVMDNNATAKNLYIKVGFKPYKRYVFLKTMH